jgi:hypothetical protein
MNQTLAIVLLPISIYRYFWLNGMIKFIENENTNKQRDHNFFGVFSNKNAMNEKSNQQFQ